MSPRWLPWTVGLLLLSGCTYPVREEVDRTVCDLAAHPRDLQPLPAAPAPMPRAEVAVPPGPQTAPLRDILLPVSAQAPAGEPPAAPPRKRLTIPPDLPGAAAPQIQLPDVKESPAARAAALNKLFPSLPALPEEPRPAPGPNGQPLTLSDLQRLATSNSPQVRKAVAALKGARGAEIQARAYPNPTIGYEGDTIGTAGTPAYQGGFVDQVIKTAGKLKLAEAAAHMDVLNAELALRRAESDLTTQVRSGYFAVLVAQETVRATRALARFTDEHYLIQVENLKGTQVAAYEPKLFRSLAMQARGSYVQAVNGYYAAWKQLAANMGLPGMPPTEVAGSADMPIPVFRFDAILGHALVHHTDVLTAQNSVQKNRYSLRLAQVTPIPDVDVRVMVQKDFTGPPFFVTPSVQVSVPFPAWDQNQGNIIQAQSTLMQSGEDVHQTRDELTRRLSEAYNRYESNRVWLEYYRDYILPDLVQVFRGIYARWDRDPLANLNFIDISTAQQNLATGITTYLGTLGTLWTSVVDVADVLQTDDLFQLADGQCPAPVPDLGQLLELPCSHPCSPLQDPALKGADPSWPSAAPPQPHLPAPAEMPKPIEEKAPPPRKQEK